jgi:hypothetical protein
VLCPEFKWLVSVSLAALMVDHLLADSDVCRATLRLLDRTTAPIHTHTETMFRAGTTFSFMSLWAIGGIILTPKLRADSRSA